MLSYKPQICHDGTMPAVTAPRRSASALSAIPRNRTRNRGSSVRFRTPEGSAA